MQSMTGPQSQAAGPDVPVGARAVRVTHPGQGACDDWVALEVPVALVYNGISHVVMMATPDLLEAFALGFSLAEGIVGRPEDIYEMEVAEACNGGMEVRMTIASEAFWKLKDRRRSMTGRTGCGICGVESLAEAVRPTPHVPERQHFDLAGYGRALASLARVQKLGALTGCTHAAVWVDGHGDFVTGAEDVGRHVALDKLLGLRARIAGARDGALVVSSRASYEMVQKAAACGVEILFAVSAPTALAIDVAGRCGMTLAAFCRSGRLNVYTAPQRLTGTVG